MRSQTDPVERNVVMSPWIDSTVQHSYIGALPDSPPALSSTNLETAMITVTSVEAQNRFGQLLDTVQREPVTITRHGRTAAFIVSPQDMQELTIARGRRSKAVAEFEAWSRRAAASALPAATDLTDDDVVRMVKALR